MPRTGNVTDYEEPAMLKIAIWGAAGNMGTRACNRLRANPQYQLLYVEPLAAGP